MFSSFFFWLLYDSDMPFFIFQTSFSLSSWDIFNIYVSHIKFKNNSQSQVKSHSTTQVTRYVTCTQEIVQLFYIKTIMLRITMKLGISTRSFKSSVSTMVLEWNWVMVIGIDYYMSMVDGKMKCNYINEWLI